MDSNGIAHVCLSRPEKLNALDLPMFEAIASEADKLRSDRSVRAVILSGKGRAFCTGACRYRTRRDNLVACQADETNLTSAILHYTQPQDSMWYVKLMIYSLVA